MSGSLLEIEPVTPLLTPGQRFRRRLLRSRSTRIGAGLVGLFLSAALLAPWISPHDPTRLVGPPFAGISADHPLGTDQLGRDILSRVIYGSRLSLTAGLVSVGLAIALGASAGAVAGYVGGRTDSVIMRGVDIMLAFPGILIALLVVTALSPSWLTVMLAVGLINVPLFCRQVRATVLSVREQDYVLACRAAGAKGHYILRRAILPALISPIVVLATLGLGTAILEVAGLSFLGIAGDFTVPEWGSMLNDAKNSIHSWGWRALVPGVAISLTVIGFNLLGDGLRDSLDPHLHSRGG